MSSKNLLDLVGVLLSGHFTVGSHKGKFYHTDLWFDSLRVLSDALVVCEAAEKIAGHFAASKIEAVVGWGIKGAMLASPVARHLPSIRPGYKPLALALDEKDRPSIIGFEKLIPGKKCLAVVSVMTFGGTASRLVDHIRKAGGVVEDLATLCDRRPWLNDNPGLHGVSIYALSRLAASVTKADECLCGEDTLVWKVTG